MFKDPGWLQTPMFAPPLTWRPPDIASLPSWENAKRVAVDIECRDDTLYELGPGVRRGGHMVGVAFAIEDGPSHYLPFAHQGGGNLDPAAVKAYLREQARVFTGVIVGAGLQYDYDYLWEDGIEFARASNHVCVQVTEALLDELQDSYGLDAILRRRGLAGKDERELEAHADAWGLHKKRELWRLHASAVGPYATRDVTGPLELLRRQEREIAEQDLTRAWTLECKVLPALLRMTRRGIPINLDKLGKISVWALAVIKEELARIKHLTGVQANSPMNAAQLAPALKARGIVVPLTADNVKCKRCKAPLEVDAKRCKCGGDAGKNAGGRPSITKQLLIDHASDEVMAAISKARAFHKLETTYCEGVRKHLVRGNMLHATFKQIRSGSDDEESEDEGARYGRVASRHVNIQASPVRNKLYGKLWRAIFEPRPGQKWVKCDYSQQEPRWLVHYAEGAVHGGLPGAKAFGDRFRNDRTTDTHSISAQITGLERDDAKVVFLAICYGQGGGQTAVKLGLPTERARGRDGREYDAPGPQAKAVIDRFDREMPFVRKLARMCMDRAAAVGYIKLFDGSRCRFPKDNHGNFDWVYKALNRLLQGNSGKQSKTALVQLDAAALDPILNVHDDFNFSFDDPQRGFEAVEIMENAVPISVPARVDPDCGSSYGDLQPLVRAA